MELAGCTFGKNVLIECGLRIGRAKLVSGDNVYINKCLIVDGGDKICIGSDVMIGPGCRLITSTHELVGNPPHPGKIINMPIIIKDRVWLCAGAIVLPGVTIESGCVIAAGAVLTRDTEPNGLYAGVPARRIKDNITKGIG